LDLGNLQRDMIRAELEEGARKRRRDEAAGSRVHVMYTGDGGVQLQAVGEHNVVVHRPLNLEAFDMMLPDKIGAADDAPGGDPAGGAANGRVSFKFSEFVCQSL